MQLPRFFGRVFVALCLSLAASTAMAAENGWVHHGVTEVVLDEESLAKHRLSVDLTGGEPQSGQTALRLNVAPDTIGYVAIGGQRGKASFESGEINHDEHLRITSSTGTVEVPLRFGAELFGQTGTGPRRSDDPTNRRFTQNGLMLSGGDVAFEAVSRTLTLEAGTLAISPRLAAALGNPRLAGAVIGFATSSVALAPYDDGSAPQHEGGVTPRGVGCGSATGPDVIVGVLSTTNYAAVGGIEACSVGTTSCNVGDTDLQWISSTNRHPVIGQSLYRLKQVGNVSQYEMIGMSWMKHGFTALTENACSCGCNGHGGSVLGVGCSDPYSAPLNGDQNGNTTGGGTWLSGGLGPRFPINAHSGVYPYPYEFRGATGSSIYKRLQVLETDLDPDDNGGGLYFVAAQYVTQDDAQFLNKNNNESYRRVNVTGDDGAWNITTSGAWLTERGEAGARAWADWDPSPNNVVETEILTPEVVPVDQPNNTSGLVILAAEATDLGGGQWHYEYLVENLNSDRSIASFSVPVAAHATVSNIGFHDVFYHDGDGYGSTVGSPVTFDGTDWPGSFSGGAVSWAYVPATPVENSNAIRFGTAFTFRFDCNAPPTTGTITLGLFKTSMTLANSVDGQTVVPCVGPQVDGMADDVALCDTPYASSAPSVVGTGTMTWSLVTGPPGAMIDSNTGVVSWPNTVAASTPYTITIEAASGCSGATHQISWMLTVALGDFDGDGIVKPNDVPPFLDVLLGVSMATDCAADMNEDGSINGDDLQLFIDALP